MVKISSSIWNQTEWGLNRTMKLKGKQFFLNTECSEMGFQMQWTYAYIVHTCMYARKV